MLATGSEVLGGRYQLLEELGQGGMGAVFRAFDRLTRQQVALKRVHARRSSLALPSREVLAETLASDPATATVIAADPGLAPTAVLLDEDEGLADEQALAFRLALAQEFRTLAALRHPNVISVLDYGFDANNRPFYTMELLAQTRPLLNALAGQPLEPRLEVLAQALRALDYLHRHGILHRELKHPILSSENASASHSWKGPGSSTCSPLLRAPALRA